MFGPLGLPAPTPGAVPGEAPARWPSRPAARALGTFAAVASGLVLAGRFPYFESAAIFSIATLACAGAVLARGRACALLLLAAAVAFGGGWYTLRLREAPRASLSHWAARAPGSLVTAVGVALRDAQVVDDWGAEATPLNAGPTTRFDLLIESVAVDDGEAGTCGTLRVIAAGAIDGPRAGDRVRVKGRLRPVEPPLNPGERDRSLLAAQSGLAGYLRLPRTELIEPLPAPAEAWPAVRSLGLRARQALRTRTRDLLIGNMEGGTDAGRAMLAAMVLGENERAFDDAAAAFTRLGLAHVMAISGFNIAAIAWVSLMLVRATGDRGAAEPLVVAGLVLLYLVVLPAEAPVQRSGIMVLAVLASSALGRRYDPLAVLAWVATAMIVVRPLDLWSLGFQLSFGLVGSMMVLGPRAHAMLWGFRIRTGIVRVPRWWEVSLEAGKALISTSVLCWAVATPIVLYHTGLFSPFAVATTLVVLPVATVMLWIAYAALIVGVLAPPAAQAAGGVISWLAEATIWLVERLDAAPWMSFHLPKVTVAWAVAATAVVIYWFALGHRRDRAAWAGFAAVAGWLAVEVFAGPRLPASVSLRIDTLAVGDGACHLVRSGDEAVLWDCGSLTPGIGRRLVPRAVRELGAWRVRTAVLTHPNYDHYSGILDAVGPLGVRRVIVSERFASGGAAVPAASGVGGAAARVLEALRARGMEIVVAGAGDVIDLGGIRLRFLSPPYGAAWEEVNDHSLVALVEARALTGTGAVTGGTPVPPTPGPRILLTGDAQATALEWLLSTYAPWTGLARDGRSTAEVMELPHHGSVQESALVFVARVDPVVVLQSTGPRRAGDPRWDELRRRRAWYTTATDGASWAEFSRDGRTVRSGAFRRPAAAHPIGR